VVLPGLFVIVMAVALRHRVLGVAAVVMAVILVAAWWPAWTGKVGPGPANAFKVRLMALNVQYTQADGAAITRQVAAADPDVVVLTELSPATLKSLDLSQYRYSWKRPTDGAFGQGIWSRWPLDSVTMITAPWKDSSVSMPELTVRTPGGPVRLVQVHPPAPTNRPDAKVWKDVLARIGDRLSQGSGPIVAAGDFNSSRWVSAYGDLLGGPNDIRDASQGRGVFPTWPQTGWLSWAPLFFPLDHVLVSRGVGVRDFRVLGATGSDHRGVLADLTIAP
jgi:endonuclease/exonuclease/phosphatase (EEP) superfamily protein YafD